VRPDKTRSSGDQYLRHVDLTFQWLRRDRKDRTNRSRRKRRGA